MYFLNSFTGMYVDGYLFKYVKKYLKLSDISSFMYNLSIVKQ